MDPGHERCHWISSPGYSSQLEGTPPVPTTETGEALMLVYDDIHVVNTVNSSLPYRYDIEEFVVHHNLYPADVFCFLVMQSYS